MDLLKCFDVMPWCAKIVLMGIVTALELGQSEHVMLAFSIEVDNFYENRPFLPVKSVTAKCVKRRFMFSL